MTVALANDLDEAQLAAVDAPVEIALAIVGPPGSGKSAALVRRAACLAAACAPRRVVLTAPNDDGIERLRREGAVAVSLGDLAFEILRDARTVEGTPGSIDAIDEVRAAQHFERAGAALFALDWTEFVSDEIDPEITGLRAPERFSAAAFRLIRKLRASLISPEEFLRMALRGATAFYGKPPNFASADLLMETKPEYRDSLRVDGAELERQRSREIDLARILARLYGSYVETLVAHGCLTPVDAMYEATLLLRARTDVAARARERFAAVLVDDAQDLTAGGLGLLRAIFGEALAGVTLAGDPEQSTRDFCGGGRGIDALSKAARVVALAGTYRSPAILRAARLALRGASAPEPVADARGAFATVPGDAVETYRAESVRDEARFVTSAVVRLRREGVAPERIAVVVRNLGCAHAYVDALLACDISVDVAGAASVYAYPAASRRPRGTVVGGRSVPARLPAAQPRSAVDATLRRVDRAFVRRCDRPATVAFRNSGRRTGRSAFRPLGRAAQRPLRP